MNKRSKMMRKMLAIQATADTERYGSSNIGGGDVEPEPSKSAMSPATSSPAACSRPPSAAP